MNEPIRILIATRNPHKVQEITAILEAGVETLSLARFPSAPALIEDADTFAGNARRKAEQLAAWLNALPQLETALPDYVLADDSGLEVDALNGLPGVRSARFAAEDGAREGNADDAANNAKLLRLLRDFPQAKRGARFRCVLALAALAPKSAESGAKNDTPLVCFEGVCEGWIDFALRGSGGFGYDPLFIPHGYDASFAQLGADQKNRISHRARALAALRGYFQNGRTPAPSPER